MYWRVISVDGHPVRGAFTFAVGPNPGPAPQFVIPSISETAATPGLLIARWIVFLSVMAAVGLLRLPRGHRAPGEAARPRKLAAQRSRSRFLVAIAVALVATPIYLFAATAKFALRSIWDVGALTPLLRASAFGRGFLDLELVLALFAIAAIILLRVERPEARQRPVAEMLALIGALLAAAAAVLVPGLAGHAAQTSPRGVSIALDWIHLASGSIWIGGLIGLIAAGAGLGSERRIPGLSVCVPRFSRVAFVSVMALIASGTVAAIIHLPTVASLWQTSYGQGPAREDRAPRRGDAVRAGQHAPQHARGSQNAEARPEEARSAASLLRVLVSGEIVLVAAVIFAAAVLSSLPPPPKALAGSVERDRARRARAP